MNYSDLLTKGFVLYTSSESKAASVVFDMVKELGAVVVPSISDTGEPHDYSIKYAPQQQTLYYCDLPKDADTSPIHFFDIDKKSVGPIPETDSVVPPCPVYLYKIDIFSGTIVQPDEEAIHTKTIPENMIAIDITNGKVSLTNDIRLPHPVTTFVAPEYTIKSDCIDTFVQITVPTKIDITHFENAPRVAYDAYHTVSSHLFDMPKEIRRKLAADKSLIINQYSDVLQNIQGR